MEINRKKITKNHNGFTLVEMLVVITIIGILATMVLLSLGVARAKARDVKRKSDLAQVGRFLTLSCFVPATGPGDYEVADLFAEISATNPQASRFLAQVPRDPRLGTETKTYYRYIVNSAGKCAIYANLEYDEEKVTLQVTAPTAGGGTGVLESASDGWNNSRRYFQVSN